MALKITDELGKELIASGKPVVIDFWAEWCGPCRQIGPFVDELAAQYEGQVTIGKYNVDEGEEISGEYGIRNIPTLLFFKDGQLVDKHVGSANKAQLEEKVKKLL
ncbi:MAG: thioredoxin [Bacteroidaceae bacterium]|jgi:thioredoxin 1|nr:thioredoxin [Bacteroidaceae bacterium]MBQ5750800.1 thioredoxin [Bacteroidaceae bacterium]MBQ6938993.1 thioredoxin [Muribaculaceae bacterium]MBR2378813.1 thioredoxin [Bacteroidaceae bacterium]MBR5843606.1 thioredoxin [Bacteroidaceae bacterium]